MRSEAMAEEAKEIPKARFQAAVKSINCDFVKDIVSIMVNNDWSAKCTWYNRYKGPNAIPLRGRKQKKLIKPKIEACKGPQCQYVTGYRDQLMEEERSKAS